MGIIFLLLTFDDTSWCTEASSRREICVTTSANYPMCSRILLQGDEPTASHSKTLKIPRPSTLLSQLPTSVQSGSQCPFSNCWPSPAHCNPGVFYMQFWKANIPHLTTLVQYCRCSNKNIAWKAYPTLIAPSLYICTYGLKKFASTNCFFASTSFIHASFLFKIFRQKFNGKTYLNLQLLSV